MTNSPNNESTQFISDFLVESRENLDQVDRDLVALEQEPDNTELIGNIFRAIHTLKGTCGFLGFQKLESVTHVGENLLSKLRDGAIPLTAEITTGLLTQVDAIRGMLDSIEQTGHEGNGDYRELAEHLTRLQEVPPNPDLAKLADRIARGATQLGNLLVHTEAASESQIAAALDAQKNGDRRPLGEILMDRERVTSNHIDEALHVQQEIRSRWDNIWRPASEETNKPAATEAKTAEGTIRVDVGLLDKLMNQVGELVLARNQILQFTSQFSDSTFLSTTQRLNLITTELQEGVMKTRMQPIGNIWNKFPRVVRDLALQCGKKVRFEMEGKETELDKTIVEAIKDPLTHLIRNAVDHGIEKPETRVAQGKPEEGCLSLRAFHEGGQVNIEIYDDGGGLHLDRIRQRAIEKGLITQDQALRLCDRETAMLIFTPGFSTAAQVTNVSGRGVGMDVVKTNVERIGGSVDIQSNPGQGTTVKIKIPLTLAIIPALVVTCGGDRYSIPQVSLLELVRLEGEQARRGIERLHGAPVYRLRGQLLPIVYLRRELGLPERSKAEGEPADDSVNIVVLRADDKQFGLVVDSINDTEEIVVKPLSKQLKGISMYAGATIMGDGRVALILDVLGIAQRSRVVTSSRDRNLGKSTSGKEDTRSRHQTLLVLAVGERRLAIPISLVSRLEEISSCEIERADCSEVVQYRGDILPLIRLSNSLGIVSAAPVDQPLQVVVYQENGKKVGLLVDQIADIVDSAIDVKRAVQSNDLLASTVIQNRVTDLLNVPSIIRKSDPSFFETVQMA